MTENLSKALELLLYGWGGVFIVLIIIYLASMALARMFPVKKKR
jgi:Na+-transporting methylmalonyl-CoA/oxaloacetate decarboxylase gamma subunit